MFVRTLSYTIVNSRNMYMFFQFSLFFFNMNEAEAKRLFRTFKQITINFTFKYLYCILACSVQYFKIGLVCSRKFF